MILTILYLLIFVSCLGNFIFYIFSRYWRQAFCHCLIQADIPAFNKICIFSSQLQILPPNLIPVPLHFHHFQRSVKSFFYYSFNNFLIEHVFKCALFWSCSLSRNFYVILISVSFSCLFDREHHTAKKRSLYIYH